MMTSISGSVVATFLIFCRVGTCMMVAPGYSRSNIPVQVRLFLAISVTLMLTPLLEATVRPVVDGATTVAIIRAIGSELVVGLVIGLTARVFFLALETMATLIANTIGLSGIAGIADEGEGAPALVPLITLTATVLFFMTDQHWELLRGLISSYRIWLPAVGITSETGITQLADHLSQAFTLALRVASPFVIYGDHRQLRGRARQQAHADHSGLLRFDSLCAVRRAFAALPHRPRTHASVHHRVFGVAHRVTEA